MSSSYSRCGSSAPKLRHIAVQRSREGITMDASGLELRHGDAPIQDLTPINLYLQSAAEKSKRSPPARCSQAPAALALHAQVCCSNGVASASAGSASTAPQIPPATRTAV